MRGVPSARDQEAVVERFITDAITEADRGQDTPADVIRARLAGLTELPGGYDFARVITQYWHGYDSGEPSLMEDALRWLRAEFTHRTDARTALGVRTTISDATFYDHLKVLARFVRLAGYRGLLVTLDEMVNLYRLSNAHSRQVNYEQLLRIVNDVHQGHAEGLGFVFAGTVDFLTDTRRGVNSYAALETRLRENHYLPDGAVDRSGPVIGLAP